MHQKPSAHVMVNGSLGIENRFADEKNRLEAASIPDAGPKAR